MGFIDYHGNKEDRYSEVLQYARDQQREELQQKETERITEWLSDFCDEGRLATWNIQDLLKLVIKQYRDLQNAYAVLGIPDDFLKQDMHTLWNDFSIDFADRHLQSFHIRPDLQEKHLQIFIDRIFKLDANISAREYYLSINEKKECRKYFTEYFDPTWNGRKYFRILHNYCFDQKLQQLDGLYETYKKLGITLSVYLYFAFRPIDEGWMRFVEAEYSAIDEIREKSHKKPTGTRPVDISNSDLSKEEQTQKQPNDIENVPQSGLDKETFMSLLERRGIPNYIEACKLLLTCDMPQDMKDNYEELLKRLPVLQDAIEKFDEVYHADIDLFNDYYAPEALNVTATFLDYQAIKPSEKLVVQTRENVILATRKLLLVVNEKIEEIYKFVTIETNAEAKALEAMMSQDGYVDSQLKIK